MLNAGIAPVVHEYGSLGCSGDLAPLSHCALALMGEGDVRDATASGCRRPTPWPRPASRPSSWRRRRAWPSSTAPTACSGCCASPSTTCASCSWSPTWPRRCRSRGCSAPTTCSPPTCTALRPQPGQAVSAANIRKVMAHSEIRRVAPHRGVHPRAGRLLAALRAGGRRRGPRHRSTTPPGWPAGSSPPPSTTRSSRRRPGREQRQLPRGAGGLRAGLPRDRGRRRRLDLGAAHRPVPRRRRAATACRRSSPTTPASTAGT